MPPDPARRREYGGAFLVIHVFTPRPRAAVVVEFEHREVRHESVRRRGVPMLLALLEEDAQSCYGVGVDVVDGNAAAAAMFPFCS